MTLSDTWSLVKESLRGSEDRDLTTMGVRRAIVLLSIPMVLEMAMEAVFALVDVFFVARLGVNAVATVGLTESVLTLIYSLSWGLGMGITAVVARRVGEKDAAGAARSAMQGLLLAVGLGIVIAIPGLLWAERILEMMGAAPDVVAEGAIYTRIMLGGNIVILLIFGLNAIFRGAGDAVIAMRSLLLANAINIVLDPILIFGIGPIEGMGLAGAAIATTIGRGTGVIYQLVHLFRHTGRIVFGKCRCASTRR